MIPAGRDATSQGPAVPIGAALAVAGVLVFFTNLDGYGLAAYGLPPPSRWVVAFTGVALLQLLVDPGRAGPLVRSPLLHWTLFYFCLTTAWGVFMTNGPEPDQVLFDRYRSMALLVALTAIFGEARARRAAALAVGLAVVVASLLNVGELAGLVKFAEHAELVRIEGRSAGLYVNPNAAGQAIVLGLALAAAAFPRAWRMPLLLVGAAGVAATFSRGAAACLLLVVAWMALRRELGTWTVVLGSACAFLLLLYGVHYLEANDLLREDTAARIRFAQDDSGRLGLALQAWTEFLEAPLLGQGLGVTSTWETAPHNIFMALAAEHGLLGLLAYPALGVAIVAGNRSALLPALVLMALGLFSHNQLTDRYALLAIALSASPGPPLGREDVEPLRGGEVDLAAPSDAAYGAPPRRSGGSGTWETV